MEIRLACLSDYDAIAALDDVAQREPARRAFIKRAIEQRNAYVVVQGASVVGYAVLEYTFYENGFISMLYVDARYRRMGLGTALMQHLERICRTPKLFTSTNQSNTEMQALLDKLGYARSGFIENLDEGDPELVYFKRIGGET